MHALHTQPFEISNLASKQSSRPPIAARFLRTSFSTLASEKRKSKSCIEEVKSNRSKSLIRREPLDFLFEGFRNPERPPRLPFWCIVLLADELMLEVEFLTLEDDGILKRGQGFRKKWRQRCNVVVPFAVCSVCQSCTCHPQSL